MEPFSGLLSGVGSLVCSGLCCVLALVLLLAGVAAWTRRGRAGPGPAPAPAAEAGTPALAAPPAALASPGPELDLIGPDDEDAPTTVLPPSAAGAPRAAPPPLPPRPAAPRALPDPGDPPRPAGPRAPAVGPGTPPPVAARSARLDADRVPDIPTLKPGATIIPPDDWDEDAVEEGDADVTMMMPRPTLPPKRS